MRRLSSVLGTVIVTVALLTAPAQAKPAVGWVPCRQNPAAQCGVLAVPVDWSRPGGSTVDIALVRRPATGQRQGTVVVSPGGPGDSGVDVVQQAPFAPELTERFDIVSFDPRGTTRSQAIQCDPDLVAHPVPVPTDAASLRRLARYNATLGAGCLARSGPLVRQMDSDSVARDIEAIRRALGADTISLYALSAGTVPAQRYAELFGPRLRALVLDSVLDRTADTRRWVTDAGQSVEQALGQFHAWCDRTPTCAVRGRSAEVIAQLLAKADRGELSTATGGAVTRWDMAGRIFAAMGMGAQSWPKFAGQLAGWLTGDPIDFVMAGQVGPTAQAMMCLDWQLPVGDLAELQELGRRSAPSLGGPWFALALVYGCHGWPFPVSDPQHRPRIHDVPTLIANGRFDASTAYAGAQRVHRQIPGSTLLTYQGVGHAVYGQSTCGKRAIETYLLTLRTPVTDCPAEWP
ncbi:alpha/beta fold hydrolase [Pseudonocardiaceae bacterium YIM PH 21723]|nr:alpha/beta fold hydrolase [Pseudonocardiaceae bacterium YIM PH 21723]